MLNSPTIRLALGGAKKRLLLSLNNLASDDIPSILVSYAFPHWIELLSELQYRDWMLDSGAFTAHNTGKEVNIDEYIDYCLARKEQDSTLVEVIALDVIGSGEGSLKNAEYMKSQGVEAIPVFHIGEDWEILKEYCKGWNKVGLSCRFGESLTESYRFYDKCFALQWPKKFHSFGWTGDKMLRRYPFHSSDSTTWSFRSDAFGRWKGFGGQRIPVKSHPNKKPEVLYFIELERELRLRWKKEMKTLEELDEI